MSPLSHVNVPLFNSVRPPSRFNVCEPPLLVPNIVAPARTVVPLPLSARLPILPKAAAPVTVITPLPESVPVFCAKVERVIPPFSTKMPPSMRSVPAKLPPEATVIPPEVMSRVSPSPTLRLATLSLRPELCVMVAALAVLITAMSELVGAVPPLQFEAVSQSPLLDVHEIVAIETHLCHTGASG